MRPGQTRGKLRAREIMLAVAAGTLAAGGAALILSEDDDDEHRAAAMAGPESVTYEVTPFAEIAIVGPQDVVVSRGETFGVRSEGSPEALAQLEAVVEDGKLLIRPKQGFGGGFNWGRLAAATVYVSLPQLDAVALAGSGDVRIDRIEGPRFTGTVAGSGELAIDAMQVDEADFSIGGSGNLVAAGTARETRVSIGGSGEFQAEDLRSQTASVSIGGSGDVALHVEGEARVSIAGSGDVDISGPARCSVTRMGSGNVSCATGGDEDE